MFSQSVSRAFQVATSAGSTLAIRAAAELQSSLGRHTSRFPAYHIPSTRLIKKLSVGYQSMQQEALAEVDYTLPYVEFNKQAFAGLKNKNGFVLHNLPQDFSTAARNLFGAFDDFRAAPPEVLAKFTGDQTIRGYYPDGTFLFGSKIGPRKFIDRDKEHKLTHVLPAPIRAKVSMQEADDKLAVYQDAILKKVMQAIESGFGLQAGQFSAAFEGYTTKTSLNHNTPVTQEKLKQWITKNKLTLTEDGRIESFLGHEDLVPLSLLIYRNNEPDGLEIESKNAAGVLSYQPVKLNGDKLGDLRIVVILGRATEILTDGVLKGAPHRVVGAPLKSGETFSRDSLNVFFFVDPNLPLKPVMRSPNGPKFQPIGMMDFYKKYSEIYAAAAEKAAVKEISAEQLKQFPMDKEIVMEETPTGPVYRRNR
jgi:isopenicillin N synthase-like dioxygenase